MKPYPNKQNILANKALVFLQYPMRSMRLRKRNSTSFPRQKALYDTFDDNIAQNLYKKKSNNRIVNDIFTRSFDRCIVCHYIQDTYKDFTNTCPVCNLRKNLYYISLFSKGKHSSKIDFQEEKASK